MPKVSVVIPSYNAADFVGDAVDSVLGQTHRDVEVIVVDDGSTDDTQERLLAYGERIRYIYQVNQERSAARNAGLDRARGEFIAFLDADDYWLPTKLEKQLELLDARPEVGMVYCRAYAVDDRGRRLYRTNSLVAENDQPESVFCHLLLGNFISSDTPVVRRDAVEAIGGFDTTLRQGEDHDYFIRLARVYPIRGLAEPLACHRVSGPALLWRLAARDAQDAAVRIVEKNADTAMCPKSVLAQAFALAWLRGAIIDLGIGRVDEGRYRLKRALGYEPGLLFEHEDAIIDRVAYLAADLCEGELGAQAGEAFVCSVWDCLPAAARAVRRRRRTLARLHAIRFFRAHWRGDRRTVLASVWPMVASDPRRLRDAGLWSVAAQAVLGMTEDRLAPSGGC